MDISKLKNDTIVSISDRFPGCKIICTENTGNTEFLSLVYSFLIKESDSSVYIEDFYEDQEFVVNVFVSNRANGYSGSDLSILLSKIENCIKKK